MIYSAGIIPYRKNDNGEYEFFLGHPGGESWSKKDYWALLKGETERGETFKATAIREFQEESGVILTKEEKERLWPLGQIRQNRRKIVIAYALEKGDIDPSKCFSNLVYGYNFPEVDKYQWIPFSEIESKTSEKYAIFYKKINEQK